MKAELSCVDIQTGRCDTYGQGVGYQNRVYLLFSGIHFDAIEFVDARGMTVTRVKPGNEEALVEAKRLASSLQKQGFFVDQNITKKGILGGGQCTCNTF